MTQQKWRHFLRTHPSATENRQQPDLVNARRHLARQMHRASAASADNIAVANTRDATKVRGTSYRIDCYLGADLQKTRRRFNMALARSQKAAAVNLHIENRLMRERTSGSRPVVPTAESALDVDASLAAANRKFTNARTTLQKLSHAATLRNQMKKPGLF